MLTVETLTVLLALAILINIGMAIRNWRTYRLMQQFVKIQKGMCDEAEQINKELRIQYDMRENPELFRSIPRED